MDYFWILNKHGYQVSYRQNIREVNKTSFALICMISTKVFFFNTPLTESRTLSYQNSAIHRIPKRVIPIRVLIQISHVLYHTSQLHCLKYRTYCTIPLSYIVLLHNQTNHYKVSTCQRKIVILSANLVIISKRHIFNICKCVLRCVSVVVIMMNGRCICVS